MKKIDRYRGSLLGLAVGDALGTTLEFRAPGTFEPIEDIVVGGHVGQFLFIGDEQNISMLTDYGKLPPCEFNKNWKSPSNSNGFKLIPMSVGVNSNVKMGLG